MESPFLTIGMPCYDDYDGVFFSVQALRLYHPEVLADIEIVVVDNHSGSRQGTAVRNLITPLPGCRYIPSEARRGPWVKDLVLREAAGQFVLCMDCHVLFPPGTIAKLLHFYKEHLDTRDLYQGPLLYDNGRDVATHFEPVWRGEMWGIWATDNRGVDTAAPPFEIPMQGMGVFSCSKAAWLSIGGFNELFAGFGGEEGYIHEKFRKAGRRTWCLPFLRWMHRFGRPAGVPYALSWEDKARNYLVGFLELGLDLEPVVAHFAQKHERRRVEKLVEQVRHEVAIHQLRKTGQLPLV